MSARVAVPRAPAMQAASRVSFFKGTALAVKPLRAAPLRVAAGPVKAELAERLRLNNLSPQKGSRQKETRKGRGYSAGQGGTCGFGMRGQKSRSGSGTRPGFEGGQLPMYRKLPKLKGICGGNPAGKKGFVTVNLSDLVEKFEEGDEVSLATLKEKRVLNLSGKEAKLPLKVLGEGELPKPLTIKAAAFSESAKASIAAAGGTPEVVPVKAKWTRKAAKRAGKSK
eukprot:jgi/Tetstr1/441955/TSEL_030160.t1